MLPMNPRTRRRRSWKRWAFLAFLFVLSLQFGVYVALIRKAEALPLPTAPVAQDPASTLRGRESGSTGSPAGIDVVVVYTGEAGRIAAGMNLARRLKPAWFFVSRTNLQEIHYHRMDRVLAPARTAGDYDSRTTDSDARATARFIREKGARRVVLVTSWFHLPRATLLTLFYLRGVPVKVRPYPAAPAPKRFFLTGKFWLEMGKGWGSLYRVARHAIKSGVEGGR